MQVQLSDSSSVKALGHIFGAFSTSEMIQDSRLTDINTRSISKTMSRACLKTSLKNFGSAAHLPVYEDSQAGFTG